MIIGLMGPAGAGKDTAGAVIAESLGGVTLAFADPIKRWCYQALGLAQAQLWGDQKEKPLSKSCLRRISRCGKEDWSWLLGDACWGDGWPEECEAVEPSNDAIVRWWTALSKEPKLTPRRVMQHFGTEFVRRAISDTFWLDVGLQLASQILDDGLEYDRVTGIGSKRTPPSNAVIITDVRFRNEALGIKRAGGLVFRIARAGGSRTELKGHASEAEQASVPDFWLDGVIENRFDSAEKFRRSVRYYADCHLRDRSQVVN